MRTDVAVIVALLLLGGGYVFHKHKQQREPDIAPAPAIDPVEQMRLQLAHARAMQEIQVETARKQQEAIFTARYGVPYRPWWSPEGPIFGGIGNIIGAIL